MSIKDILLVAIVAILSAISWLVKVMLWSFILMFQTVDGLTGFLLEKDKKSKKAFLLRLGIAVMMLVILISPISNIQCKMTAAIILAVGYCMGLMVFLQATYINMVRIAKKLSQSEKFCQMSGSSFFDKNLTLYQFKKGPCRFYVNPEDLINNIVNVEKTLENFLSSSEIENYSESLKKTIVAMAMMIVGVNEIKVLNYSKTASGAVLITPIKGGLRFGKRMGYIIVRKGDSWLE